MKDVNIPFEEEIYLSCLSTHVLGGSYALNVADKQPGLAGPWVQASRWEAEFNKVVYAPVFQHPGLDMWTEAAESKRAWVRSAGGFSA